MKENKEEEILGFLQERKYAEVSELAAKLYLSASTVRRRLTELEKKGLVTRTHGGAEINDGNNFLPSFTFRAHQNSLEKKKIALNGDQTDQKRRHGVSRRLHIRVFYRGIPVGI